MICYLQLGNVCLLLHKFSLEIFQPWQDTQKIQQQHKLQHILMFQWCEEQIMFGIIWKRHTVEVIYLHFQNLRLVKKLPVIIWTILYQISFSTSAFWISLATTSTYQIRFYANISAKIAILRTKSSLINGSFLAYKYPSNSATILLTFSWLQIK